MHWSNGAIKMTFEQHAQRIRQLELQLEKADFGLGMPRDYPRVLELRVQLETARKDFNRAIIDSVNASMEAEADRMASDGAEDYR